MAPIPFLVLIAMVVVFHSAVRSGIGAPRSASASWFESSPLVEHRCGFTFAPPLLHDRVVALPLDEFAGSAACGRCVIIHCTDVRCAPNSPGEEQAYVAPVKALVVDACNDCTENEVALGQETFYAVTRGNMDQLGNNAAFDVEWDFFECSEDLVQGGVKLQLHPATSSIYFAVKLQNSMQPVESVTLIKRYTRYALERTHENYFEVYFSEGSRLTNPYTLEFHSKVGSVLTQELTSFRGDDLISTELQFSGGPTTPPAPPSRETSAGTLYGGRFDIRDPNNGISFASDEWWMQWDNGYIETDVKFPGESLLQIEMAGDRGIEWPLVNIYLDGGDVVIAENLVVASSFKAQQYTFYNFTVVEAGTRPLKIEFINNYSSTKDGIVTDSNLYVRRVIVTQPTNDYLGPQMGPTPSNALAASFAASSGAGREVRDHRGHLYSMHTRGWIQQEFDAGKQMLPVKIDIEAQSNLVNGDWAIMRLVINRKLLGERIIETPSGFANFTYVASGLSGPFDLRIEYTNGFSAKGIRALVLNRIYLSSSLIESG